MQKDDATWLNVAYLISVVIGIYVFHQALETVAIQGNFDGKYGWYEPVTLLVSAALSGAIVYFYCKKPERREYHLASIAELRKVTWPTTEVTKRYTIIVVIFVAIFSAIMSLFDYVWSYLLKMIIA